MNTWKRYSLALLLLISAIITAKAQYFGRNKVNYETFDFKVHQSEHFEIYNYLQNQENLTQFAEWAEQWYQMHQNVLKDTILSKNPLILYNNHADFQQTNAIFGQVGVGTGGVTEAFKNRVILPFAMSNQQTFHVLGHELVHAFQYNMVINGDSTNLNNIGNLPLWLVEGLAEYMSIGSVDAHTAMWMRDAVLHDKVPTIKDLENPNFFPYRYGQAFWAFLTGLYGDEVIEPFYKTVAKFGFEAACPIVLNMSQENLSELWVSTLKTRFASFLGDKKERFVGTKLLSSENAGRMNISPVLSPNGRYIIFLSEKDLFGIDLFLADATKGEIIRKVASTTRDGHLDDFDYIESAGTWSPDGERFAFVAFGKGRNILVIKEAQTGKTVDEIAVEGVRAFTNPAWSPDGKTIVFSGLEEGQVDLYSLNVRTKKVEQLTNDPYSEMHPHWSADGNKILFATDELSFERGRRDGKWSFNLAEFEITSRQTNHIQVFPDADNLNPMYDTDGNIWFLSNRDGFRNIYKYEPASGKVFQMTDMLTGVSGITHYAPAMSIDRRRNRIAYMYYAGNSYIIYRAKTEDFLNKEVDPNDVNFDAATLPRVNRQASNIVDAQLADLDQNTRNIASLTEQKYKPKFRLDYVGGSTGVGTNNAFGTQTGLVGGVDLLFGDILGNNQLFTSASLNGEITDFAGSVSYLFRKHRLNWGAIASHVPYRSFGYGGTQVEERTIGGVTGTVITDNYLIQRIFEERLGGQAIYPFSSTLRVEGQAFFTRYSSRVDQYSDVYTAIATNNGYYRGSYLGQERDKLDSEPGFNLWSLGTALVGDNSYFGLTAPLEGHRFRLGIDQYIGEYTFASPTADFRVYRFFKPIGFAFRAMHTGRYGEDADIFYPNYIGSPWFVRGYNYNRIEDFLLQNGLDRFASEGYSQETVQNILAQTGELSDQLIGSKLLVSNFEIRIPFTGPEQLALIKSGFLFSDLNFFVDGGIAFTNYDQFDGSILQRDFNGDPIPVTDPDVEGLITDPATGETLYRTLYPKIKPVFSAGVSLRVNLFGALILEPYYARPFLKGGKFVFGLNIIPGW
ncbi:MAG: PD40 domain-containing protein [Saprospiraceae bacterium]|nr:PD40 domain-containing protein [Saprospiraceae bacterium]